MGLLKRRTKHHKVPILSFSALLPKFFSVFYSWATAKKEGQDLDFGIIWKNRFEEIIYPQVVQEDEITDSECKVITRNNFK